MAITDEPRSPSAPAGYEPKLGGHIPALDALRGIAILLVTAYRFNFGPEDPSTAGRIVTGLLGRGTCGVDLFFVLSGFLITGILFDARGTERYFRNFYMRRVLRIFPLYFGMLLLAFGLLPLLPGASNPYDATEPHQQWLWFYGANIYLAWENSWISLGWFSHFWSLAVEEHFYLVWPLVIVLLPRRAAMGACLVCAFVALACRIGLALAGDYAVAVEALTPCRLDGLAIGAFLALAARGPGGVQVLRPSAVRALIGVLILLVGLSFGDRYLHVGRAGHLAIELGLYAVLFGALLIIAVSAAPWSRLGGFLQARWLRFFGKYSYGMYVFQNPLIPIGLLWFTPEDTARLTGSPLLGRLLYILAMTALTVAVALVSWNLLEKPFLNWKRAFEPHSARRATPPVTEPVLPTRFDVSPTLHV
jgi:peptidoglycan/LPS O-acetylase OafA/YrhL